jgi:2-methylcitrate dehydratase PrpD
MAILPGLAETLSAIRGSALDDGLLDVVRHRVFDTLGATAVGTATEEGRLLGVLDARLSGSGQGQGEGNALARCAFLIGATRATEIDDIDIRSCTTVGSVIVPVALVLAATAASAATATSGGQEEHDDRDFCAAIVTGYEAMIRLGRAISGATLIYRGVWPTYVTAAFASAACVSNYLRLAPKQFANALGIALTRVAPIGRDALAQPAFRQFALGAAANDGWIAARAAQSGLSASDSALPSFIAAIGATLSELELTADTSRPKIFDVDTKCFPTSRQAMASVAAFSGLLPLDVEQIDTIDVYVPAAYRAMVDQPQLPRARIGSMIGVQYQMALAALGLSAYYDALRAPPFISPEVKSLMDRINVHSDEGLSRAFPATWGSRVVVKMKSGRSANNEVLHPAGSPASSLDWKDLEQKFERIAGAGGLGVSSSIAELRGTCQLIAQGDSANVASELLQKAQCLGDELRVAAAC